MNYENNNHVFIIAESKLLTYGILHHDVSDFPVSIQTEYDLWIDAIKSYGSPARITTVMC